MYKKICLLIIAVGLLFGFQQKKSIEETKIKKGMVKVAIFYPTAEGKTFDMEYYSTKHMPLAATLFGSSLKAMSIDKGLAGGAPNTAAPYVAIGYFFFENMESFQKSMGAHQAQLKADVPNYTNIQPVLQISEVLKVE